jgi:Protein phosphatase 2C
VQIAAASEPGSPDKPNEDAVIVTADMAAVLDGATVRTDTGCIHGVSWFVEKLAGSLARNKELPPAQALAAAITETAAVHSETCDLSHPGTPGAALAIIQVHEEDLRYLVLGDVTLVIETTDGLRIISDNRVNGTASAERAIADALPADSPEKTDALVRMKHAELAARNVLTGDIPLKTIHRAAMLTDGAARAVFPFKLYDWPDLMSALTSDGPGALIKRVRIAEDADPMGMRRPRNKIHDDATIAVVNF